MTIFDEDGWEIKKNPKEGIEYVGWHGDFTPEKVKYGLMAIPPEDEFKKNKQMLHFAGYASEPTQEDIDQLYDDLYTDPDIMVERSFIIVQCSPEEVKYIVENFV